MIQLHGDEDVIYIEQLRQQTDKEIWKAVRVKDTKDIKEAQQLPVDKLLLDTFAEGKDMYGGTGKVMNYDLIPKEGIRKPFFIAGGLHSKNIKEITKKSSSIRDRHFQWNRNGRIQRFEKNERNHADNRRKT